MMIQGSRRLLLLLVLMITCIGCDQATKQIARDHLSTSEPISLLGDMVRFEYAENPGAFLSMGADLPESTRVLLFTVFTSMAVAALVTYALRSRDILTREVIALSLLAGGGVGNLIDRATNGAVVDFMSISLPPLRTGIFNVADMAVTAGALLLIWSAIARSIAARRKPDAEEPNTGKPAA